MCGIAGIFAYNLNSPSVDRDELFAIRDQMAKRGPDGKGAWFSPDGLVGLGHRRLAIIDLSDNGSQPMINQDGTLIITFNGEIYNYRELRAGLESRGNHFRSNSDTEVLLHLYNEKGFDMVHDLRGMYAFALWDSRRKGLYLARDPFGIKPLYYADDGRTLRFASQVKALKAGGRIDTAADPAGHVGFFLWGHVPEPFSLYRGISALPAGTWRWVDSYGGKKETRFHDIRKVAIEVADDFQHLSQSEMRERLHCALLDSVSHHLIADVPVGIFLSSGLDSSILTSLAAETGANLFTTTLGFNQYRGTKDDEAPLAEDVAQLYGTRHQTVWMGDKDFHSELPNLIEAMDQPTIDGVNSYFVSKAAVQAGLKVCISGLGGDELFGGYNDFQIIPKLVGLNRFFRLSSGVGKGIRILAAPILKRMTNPKYASILEYGGTFGGAYLLKRCLYMPWELPEILDDDMVREGWTTLKPLLHLEEMVQDLRNDFTKVSVLEINNYMRNQLLRDTDWASMAQSLEVRVPLVDIFLFHCVANLQNALRKFGKQDMLFGLSRPLPEAIVTRDKTGFSVPVREWLSPLCNGQKYGLRDWARYVYDEYK